MYLNKEVLIFGAYGALGRGLVNSFRKKDYDKIYLFDLQAEENGITDSKVVNINVEDLTKEENVNAAFDKVKSNQKTLFFLYSTVGGFSGGKPLWETDVEDWQKMFDMNVKSNYLIAKQFASIVKDSAGGSICFTAAYVGLKAENNKAGYGASKAALIHLVHSLSLEGKDIKLTVNAIAPYIIDTPANRKWMKNDNYDGWTKPEEIGNLAHALFMNYNFVTGNILTLTSRFPATY